eukprot:6475579-Amphidinium_carterae.2
MADRDRSRSPASKEDMTDDEMLGPSDGACDELPSPPPVIAAHDGNSPSHDVDEDENEPSPDCPDVVEDENEPSPDHPDVAEYENEPSPYVDENEKEESLDDEQLLLRKLADIESVQLKQAGKLADIQQHINQLLEHQQEQQQQMIQAFEAIQHQQRLQQESLQQLWRASLPVSPYVVPATPTATPTTAAATPATAAAEQTTVPNTTEMPVPPTTKPKAARRDQYTWTQVIGARPKKCLCEHKGVCQRLFSLDCSLLHHPKLSDQSPRSSRRPDRTAGRSRTEL